MWKICTTLIEQSIPIQVLTASTVPIPPPLPPSVEEAYRRKCIQLKQRMNEIEEANDASRLRLSRIHRGIEKLRLERAFLLEQLAKRTSTNVEDSEGSPSPPPTPKEKPLRTKRGHRKPSFLANLGDARPGSAFIQQGGGGPMTISPSSDAFSHTHANTDATQTGPQRSTSAHNHTNGTSAPPSKPPSRPKSGFDIYCQDMRSVLMVKHRQQIKDGTYDVDKALAEGWQHIGSDKQEEFYKRFDKEKKKAEAERELAKETAASGADADTPMKDEGEDEDVQMPDEVEEAEGEADSGFTAVNRP